MHFITRAQLEYRVADGGAAVLVDRARPAATSHGRTTRGTIYVHIRKLLEFNVR